ncbi:S1 family peptidase [Jatrophihabitans sp.]|uniref:S1 family peptidase n=1 Tax=Jatrophihabitans sp. TaxID=1932789 RepID=UPI002BC6E9F9|nr:serine protease [Jatrophihabitans sp.]
MTFLSRISRRPFQLLAALVVTATALTVPTAAASAAPVSPQPAVQQLQSAGLAATISLDSGCSASLARYPSSSDTDRALMLTNGHCWEGSVVLPPGVVLVDLPSIRTGELLDASGQPVATVQADRLLYATMTGTDVALYRLTQTFAQIEDATGLSALTIASSHPADGTAVSIPSGYWKTTYSCAISGFVPTLREAVWTWHDSIRYQYPDATCLTVGGTSGSPIVDDTTLQIVGINNTLNEQGQACTLNNPCEVDPDGSFTSTPGQNYGQQTYWFTTCLTSANTLDLDKAGCLLPKPLI